MLQDHFEEFYEDIFEELTNIGGELEQLRVCENLSDHLAGNVYAKFREEEDAEKALQKLMVPSSPPTLPSLQKTHTGVSLTPAAARVSGSVLRRAAHPGAVLPGDRLQGCPLPPVRGDDVRSRRLLQLYAPEEGVVEAAAPADQQDGSARRPRRSPRAR